MSKKPELRGRAARLARLLPAGPAQAARTPFVLLVVLLLGGGLITLLILNSSLNQGSFQLTKLKKETQELTDEEQELQKDVDEYAAPDALQRRARELGMVPGGDPAFLFPDGTVRGKPGVAPGSALRESAARRPVPVPGPSRLPAAPTSAAPAPEPAAATSPSAPVAPGTPPGPQPSAPATAPPATPSPAPPPPPAAPAGPAPTTPGR
ncbi:septum formation initiator family protein [Streptomyces flavofungini]|uniref:septum formation initiator family protein n=1 Tax=Streptomyces flavofungini TaxID=68200 RepID=UPI0025B0DEF2|nr:septum formation initiator family protein [Streptomyces flavofungini]WJV49317.1 septum formation initiator family protein [Streptomyces flavofungini]